MGLRSFNRTGQENTTTEVLRRASTPADRRRNALLIVVALVAIVIMGALAYQRSGLSFIPSADSGEGIGRGHTGADNPDRPERP